MIRPWVRVHGFRDALVIGGVTSVLAIGLGRVSIDALGMIALPARIPLALLAPVPLAVAVAAAATNDVDRSLASLAGRRRPVLVARLASLTGALVLAASVLAVVCLVDPRIHPAALARNLLVFGAIAVAMVVLGRPELAWLPTSAVLLGGMTVGHWGPDGDTSWWAMFLDDTATGPQLLGAAGLWAGVTGVYVLRGGSHRGEGT